MDHLGFRLSTTKRWMHFCVGNEVRDCLRIVPLHDADGDRAGSATPDGTRKAKQEVISDLSEAATHPDYFKCGVTSRDGKRQDIAIDGAILVWGRVLEGGREAVKAEFGFADILSALKRSSTTLSETTMLNMPIS